MLSSLALIDCEYYGNVEVIYIIKNVLSFIRIFVPIILIIMCMIDGLKAVIHDSSKEYKLGQKIAKRLFVAAIIFIIPSIIDIIMQISDGINLTSDTCWSEATKENVERLKEKAKEEAKAKTEQNNNNFNSNVGSRSASSNINYTEPSYNSNNSTDSDDSTGNSTDNTKKTAEAYLFLGDSRTVGMDSAVGKQDKVQMRGKVGARYDWFAGTGISEINSLLKSVSGSAYIFVNMGVNGVDEVNKYISKYKSLATSDWKGHKIVVVSVGPVDEAEEKKHGYSVTNSQIEDFNKKLKNGISSMSNISYCDIYNNVKGYKTTDGVHYTNDTYKKIYNYIMNNCRT